ncbi:DUF1338 domain-containing protein [Agaribacter marinus]|uniref:2-oxoadipate dioxygenase/decarboxylase n=1 Tax=Agaribacter marinus TaxID=1431249 RepID=A0AA37SZ21_9ALTE|nr:DUF1338 domain-containing protein [Agaribacter marinus]GLR72298.1 DUF1338 domain-containing protein [Agaribacter marinus]
MHATIDDLFTGLWQDYIRITPSATAIHQLLKEKTSATTIVNDHIALRTFNHAKVNLAVLAKHFLSLGYEAKGEYDFSAKKLNAKHFEHADLTKPKVFISELKSEEMSAATQGIISSMLAQMPDNITEADDFLYSGTHWQVSSEDYKTLLAESEYAAWMAAWGYRANHFTVSINHLAKKHTLEEINDILKSAGFTLNTSGGEVKGGKDVCLAQSSTMADKATVEFSDKALVIPSCFYEFAERFILPTGELYQGFVAASADKIFESTNAS